MTAKGAEWLIVGLFFVGFFAYTIGEVLWLNRKNNVAPGKALAISFAPGIFGITVGFFFSMVLVFGILAMAWDSSLQSIKGGDATIWAVLIFAAVVPFALLALVKYLMLKLFNIEAISTKFKYSVVSSIIFFAAVSLIPLTAAYVRFR